MIASLMMYLRPETEAAHSRFWSLLREHLDAEGVSSPDTLAQNAPEFDVWLDPSMVFSQTCGLPYRTYLAEKVSLIGTPDYGLKDCSAGYYRSPLVVRTDDTRTNVRTFADARFAYNASISQSGFAAPYWHCREHGFWFSDRLESGSHRTSAKWVAEGKADIASLDAVTWRMIQRYDGWADRLRVLDWTRPTPGLPYITAAPDAAPHRRAVVQAIAQLSVEDRETLCLKGLVQIPADRYLRYQNPPETPRSAPGPGTA